MEMKVETAYEKALETVISWINSEVNKTKTQVFFRTYAPVHFRYVYLIIHLFSIVFSFYQIFRHALNN